MKKTISLCLLFLPFWAYSQGLHLSNNVKFVGSSCVYLVLSGTNGGLNVASGSSLTGTNLKMTGNLANEGTIDIQTCDVVFNGTVSQAVSGAGTTIFDTWNFNNSANGTLSGLTQIRKLLTLTNGNIASNGNLKLLSDATNTAMVVNTNGIVTGNATQQRYIDGSYNGVGYHYLSSPVQSANISTVFSSKMNLVCNTAFNAATEPAYVTPFPTFYHFDESLSGTPKGTNYVYDAFMAAWQVPNCAANMTIGKGYIANIAKGQTIDYQGVLNNGDITIALTRGSTGTERAWNLVGNPYPSPVEWSKILALSSNVDNAIYQRIATGQYSGTWASFVAGVGTNGGMDKIATGQAFLVRCSNTAGGNLAFKNSVRLTTYENPSFFRIENQKQGLIKLALISATQTDETAVYFEKNATADFDSKFDAAKVQTNAGVTLYTKIKEQKISINGQADFEEKTEIPLIFYVPQKGSYSFETTQLDFFDAKTEIFLEDKIAKKHIDLRQNKSYSFAAKTGTDATRFVLKFQKPLPQLAENNIFVYPNPTEKDVKIRFANNYEGQILVRILDLQGKVLKEVNYQKNATSIENSLLIDDLEQGLYLIDIQTDTQKFVRKFVKQ